MLHKVKIIFNYTLLIFKLKYSIPYYKKVSFKVYPMAPTNIEPPLHINVPQLHYPA